MNIIIPEQNLILQKIGQYIIDSQLNNDWKTAILKLAVIGQSIDFNLTFKQFDEEFNTKLQGAFMCSIEVKSLHKLTHKNPNYSKWNRAIYVLNKDNSFEIEYQWDQDLHDQIASNE